MANTNWNKDVESTCPKCGSTISGAFPEICPFCDLSTKALADMGTTSFQKRKLTEHTDLLYGREVAFYDKSYNASFDFNGYANLQDLVRYTITYGDNATLPGRVQSTPILLVYVPETIGAGTAIHYPSLVPCTGVCLVSPNSTDWGHTFPVIDEWAKQHFGLLSSECRYCGKPVQFGVPVCSECYKRLPDGWKSMI